MKQLRLFGHSSTSDDPVVISVNVDHIDFIQPYHDNKNITQIVFAGGQDVLANHSINEISDKLNQIPGTIGWTEAQEW